MTTPTMYPQVTRVFMIPATTTSVGLEWARGRVETYVRLTEHIGEATRAVSESGATQFVIEPQALKMNLLRQSRATERGSSRKLQPAYNVDEITFFELVENVAEKALAELRKGKDSSLCRDGWAILTGAHALFPNGPGVPQFLGLNCLPAIRSILARSSQEVPKTIGFEEHADALLGAGVLTALRVYLSQEKLGPERTDLAPHRLHRVDWKEYRADGVRESHAWVIGSFGIDPR